ncbi:MAG: N-acetylmuramoyl-L-alanine amidase [Candidatus Omnitrophica bacterium]|nr:N-acetylmuramoyl-L-alanine amidase [Candidatus Omnitrophota bacterium]
MKISKKYKTSLVFLVLFMIAGCTTTPPVSHRTSRQRKPIKGVTYNIGKKEYVPLASVLATYGADYDWDSIGKKLTIYRDDNKVTVCLGSRVAMLNKSQTTLSAPVRMYKSLIVFPSDFVSESLADFFSERRRPSVPRKKKVIQPAPEYAIRRVVIDSGHGGRDPGAIGEFGVREKKITLDIAKRLKHYLEGSGIKVVLTRDRDTFISLWKRANVANKQNADFFISIHANASRSKYVKGFEIFYLSEAVDDNARAIAAAENASLKYESSSFGDRRPSNSLEATIWDLKYSENRRVSIELADCIAKAAYRRLGVRNRGVKAARFYVLKGAEMPSVLIEVGFLSNRQEAAKLNTSKYREKVAKAIATGILDYKQIYEESEAFTK